MEAKTMTGRNVARLLNCMVDIAIAKAPISSHRLTPVRVPLLLHLDFSCSWDICFSLSLFYSVAERLVCRFRIDRQTQHAICDQIRDLKIERWMHMKVIREVLVPNWYIILIILARSRKVL